jgi:hypothetical protein
MIGSEFNRLIGACAERLSEPLRQNRTVMNCFYRALHEPACFALSEAGLQTRRAGMSRLVALEDSERYLAEKRCCEGASEGSWKSTERYDVLHIVTNRLKTQGF